MCKIITLLLIYSISFNCKATTVLMIGDSIAAGTVEIQGVKYCTAGNPIYPSRSCRGRGARNLGGWAPHIHSETNFTVLNYGVSGETTNEILSRSRPLIDSSDIILLMGGTNDLISTTQPLEKIINNLESIVQYSLSKNKKIVVATIPPMFSRYPFLKSKVDYLNSRIRKIKGANIADLNMNLRNGWPSYNSSDGIHLNLDSYKSSAIIWVEAIQEKSSELDYMPSIIQLLIGE